VRSSLLTDLDGTQRSWWLQTRNSGKKGPGLFGVGETWLLSWLCWSPTEWLCTSHSPWLEPISVHCTLLPWELPSEDRGTQVAPCFTSPERCSPVIWISCVVLEASPTPWERVGPDAGLDNFQCHVAPCGSEPSVPAF
jgi:hypothetical protein